MGGNALEDGHHLAIDRHLLLRRRVLQPPPPSALVRKVLLPAAPATALVRETCWLGFNTWLRLVDAGTPVRRAALEFRASKLVGHDGLARRTADWFRAAWSSDANL